MENLNNSTPVRFRATPKLMTEFDKIAEIKGVKKSELLREILREYVAFQQESLKKGG